MSDAGNSAVPAAGAAYHPPSRRALIQPGTVVAVTVLWVALWRDLSWFNIVAGALLGLGVQILFPLPRVRLDGRLRPVYFAVFLFSFLWQLVVASIHVSATVLSPKRQLRNAVIEVDLTTDSDFVLTAVAITTSLIPGSIVVEARRSTHTLFLHALDVRDEAGAERERARVLHTEAQLIRSFGSPPARTPAASKPAAPQADPNDGSPDDDRPNDGTDDGGR